MALVDEEIGTRTLREINNNLAFWEQFEHDNWRVINFTGKTKARFGWCIDNMYTKYVEVEAHQARFLIGVDPDVIDQLINNHD